MAKRLASTPKKDGFRMPWEFEPHKQIWMIWPERPDNWQHGGTDAQKAFTDVAKAVSRFTPVTMCVSARQYENCRNTLPENIRVVEVANDDAWMRDCGPTFVVNDKGDVRAVDWDFNAWGGLVDGLYFPWAEDQKLAQKVCEIEGVDTYHTPDFVLEGGSIHVDGEGTVMVTEMCLLSEGRNPHMSKEEIEEMLKDYLNVEKVLWVKDGIDPEETNGHIDDVACFVRPGEAACIYTEDETHPFYTVAKETYDYLSSQTDAKGRKLKVHKLCTTIDPVTYGAEYEVDTVAGSIPRHADDICITSYMNFLITNGAIIAPQYGDKNDALALEQLQEMFPDHEIVGVQTRQVVYGGGNIHCITQQQPKG